MTVTLRTSQPSFSINTETIALCFDFYAYAEWKRARVAPDYHIEIADHFYSVPSKLIREVVEARFSSATEGTTYCQPRVLARSQ